MYSLQFSIDDRLTVGQHFCLFLHWEGAKKIVLSKTSIKNWRE
jgi:hypothetical protein